ncbi:MAG: hypothetical protein RLZZ244_200, partial [Verrucomicrobiota bacterium]
MSVSEWCIRRPVATVLLMVGMVLAGMLGYFSLPISALPAVDFPTLEVRAGYPGASAEVMAASVTTPLERQLGQISGLEAMTSSTSEGFASITLRFDLGRDIDSAAQDVQAAINAASGVIPRNLPSPPTYSKVNPADAPILTLVASSKTLSLERVNDFADTALAQKLSQVSGVGLVSIQGNLKPAVRVRVNPGALANLGLSLEEVRAAILVSNVNSPKGTLDGKRQAYAIGTNDQITSARDFGSVVVAYRNGAPVRVQDLGAAVESVENVRIGAWVGGHPAVVVDVQRQPGANIIETAERVKALLPSLRLAAPPGVELGILQDRTETIRASIRDVQFTLGLTVILVVLVIFLFLRRLWATVIPGVALPLALIGTFGIMRLLGFSLNNLSLMAITISTGFVVDDAIVMIENIFRYIEEGEPPFTAAIKGAKQIGFTVISLSVSLIAVFIPLLFMPGVVGRLFKEFAMTLSAAVVVSAVVSLTLTPMMCARLLKPETEASRGWFFRVTEKGFDAALAWYAAGLRWVLRHRALTLWVTLGTLAVTVALYGRIPKGLLPLQDTGLLVGVTETSPTESFDAMVQRQAAVVEAVRADPDVVSVASLVGGGGMNPTLNTGKLYIQLRPREEGRAGSEVVMRRLRQAAGAVPGITLFLKGVQDIQLESRPSRTQYQLTLQSANEEELAQWAWRLKEGLERCRQLREVASDLQMGGLQVRVEVDRELASRRNVTMQAIDETL